MSATLPLSPLERQRQEFLIRKQRAQWQMHFEDWCLDNVGGANPTGRDFDRAAAYADSQMEDE